jgi:hypothetical protein
MRTPVVLAKRFSDDDVHGILDQAMVYVCACPAQVCKAILEERSVFDYQAGCLDMTDTDASVHRTIAEAIQRSHPILEECLHQVLTLEGWNMSTLEMPQTLQKRMIDAIGE